MEKKKTGKYLLGMQGISSEKGKVTLAAKLFVPNALERHTVRKLEFFYSRSQSPKKKEKRR